MLTLGVIGGGLLAYLLRSTIPVLRRYFETNQIFAVDERRAARAMKWSLEIFAIGLALFLIALIGKAQAQSAIAETGNDVVSDFKWTANNAVEDVEDVVTAFRRILLHYAI